MRYLETFNLSVWCSLGFVLGPIRLGGKCQRAKEGCAMMIFSSGSIRRSVAYFLVVIGTIPLGVSFAQTPTTSTPIKIGIIGSGNIGGTLGTFWAKAGHQILFSSRNPENLKPLVEKVGPQA